MSSESGIQSGSRLVEALYSISTQVLCVTGVAVGSHHALKRWIAVSALTPPETPKGATEAKKRSKLVVRTILIGIVSLFVAVEFGIIYGVQQIKSEQWLNIFWAGFEGIMIAVFTFSGTLLLCPVEQSFSLVPHKFNDTKYELKQHSRKLHWSRFVGSIGAAVTCIYLSSQGIRAMQPSVVAGWLMSSVGLQHYPTMSVRWATIFMNAYIFQFGVPILAFVIGVIGDACSKAYWGDTPKSAPEPSPPLHAWLARLMLMLGGGLPSLIPSILITMALRFDYSQTQSSIALRGEPGEAVAMPSTTPRFSKPMFTTALGALIGSLAIGEIVITIWEPEHITDFGMIVLTIPIVSLALLGRAASVGQLKKWWMYREVWIPNKEDLAKPTRDIETPAAAEEKAALLSTPSAP